MSQKHFIDNETTSQLIEDALESLKLQNGALHVDKKNKTTNSADHAIGPDEVELGMGIHNETGARRLSPRPDSTAIINLMLDYLLSQDDEDRAYVDFDGAEHVVLMVNNLGALSVLELPAITLIDLELLRSAVTSACQAPIAAAPSITDYDTIVGDGDCGTTLQRACEEVIKTMAGTSGAGGDSAVGALLRIARAVYVNEKGWDAVPDPGAMGVVALIQGLAEGISSFVARQE
ncbi:hypothetical protein LQW54_009251 [Pestalotiopsis sp. IQ-011]